MPFPANGRDWVERGWGLGEQMELLAVGDLADGAARLDGIVDRPLVAVDLTRTDWASPAVAAAIDALGERSVVTLGWSSRPLPPAAEPLLAALTLTIAPAGPGRFWVHRPEVAEDVARVVAASPLAATTLAWLLPATARADVADGLQLESLAYSSLLAGPEFTAWRTGTPRRPVPADDEPVLLARDGDVLTVTLNRPARRNAFDRGSRDGLLAALDVARWDPTVRTVVWRGAGPSFCAGGDLDEFGTAANPAAAHLLRLSRSAGWAVHGLRDRVRPLLHGACIGAGIEIPAFAGHISARSDAWFQLPEVTMGLIPGAGGTVSVTRRIGRWRTAFLVLTRARLDAATAREWGLVDEIV